MDVRVEGRRWTPDVGHRHEGGWSVQEPGDGDSGWGHVQMSNFLLHHPPVVPMMKESRITGMEVQALACMSLWWEETGVPSGNPHKHGENMQTHHRVRNSGPCCEATVLTTTPPCRPVPPCLKLLHTPYVSCQLTCPFYTLNKHIVYLYHSCCRVCVRMH